MGGLASFLTLGLDSFAVCVGFGALDRPRWNWMLLAASFGIADGSGTVIGSIVGQWNPGDLPVGLARIAPAAMAAYGCLVALLTTRVAALVSSRVGLVLLPLVLSLDNFVSAAVADDGAPTQVFGTFLATSAMALLGCAAGAAMARRWPSTKRVLPGGAALVAAVVMNFA